MAGKIQKSCRHLQRLRSVDGSDLQGREGRVPGGPDDEGEHQLAALAARARTNANETASGSLSNCSRRNAAAADGAAAANHIEF